MERLIYEGRFLVNTVGGIMRQDDLREMYGRVNWEKCFGKRITIKLPISYI